jgi:hypothetical protein
MGRIVVVTCLAAATWGGPLGAQQPDEAAVMATVQRLFDAMRAGDSAMARSVFHPDARLVATGEQGVRLVPVDGFLRAIGSPHEHVWDERIWDAEVRVDGDLATVWTPYAFYLGGRFSHCGVDGFQMVRADGSWQIVSLADTRRQQGCEPPGDR